MFDEFWRADPVAALRGAAVYPAAALGIWLAYLGLIPLVAHIPGLVFEAMRLTLLIGAGAGLISGTKVFRRGGEASARFAMTAVLWLAINLLDAYLLVEMSLPWLL